MPIQLLTIKEFKAFTSAQLVRVHSVDIRFSRELTQNDLKQAPSVYDIAVLLCSHEDLDEFCEKIKNCGNLFKISLPQAFNNITSENQINFLEKILLANRMIDNISPLNGEKLSKEVRSKFNAVLSRLKNRYFNYIQKTVYRNTYSQYIKMFDIIDTLESKTLTTKSSHHAFSDFRGLKQTTVGTHEQPHYVSDKEVHAITDQTVQIAINDVVVMRKAVHPIRASQPNTVVEQAKAVSNYKLHLHLSVRPMGSALGQRVQIVPTECRSTPMPQPAAAAASSASTRTHLTVKRAH